MLGLFINTELLRTKTLQARPREFQQLAQQGETACQALEELLKVSPIDSDEASCRLLEISNNCRVCHQTFRDVPLRR